MVRKKRYELQYFRSRPHFSKKHEKGGLGQVVIYQLHPFPHPIVLVTVILVVRIMEVMLVSSLNAWKRSKYMDYLLDSHIQAP